MAGPTEVLGWGTVSVPQHSLHRPRHGASDRLEAEPTTSLSRVTRQALQNQAVALAWGAAINRNVCIETQADEDELPWVIGKVLKGVHEAAEGIVWSCDSTCFNALQRGRYVLEVQLYELLERGSLHPDGDLDPGPCQPGQGSWGPAVGAVASMDEHGPRWSGPGSTLQAERGLISVHPRRDAHDG